MLSKKSVGIALMSIGLAAPMAAAQTVYTGTDVAFEKDAFADHLLPENQDALSESVILTRQTVMGIFNIAQEEAFQGMGIASPSPVGTRWAFGSAADHASLTFGTWGQAHLGSPPGLVGQHMVLHLVAEDIYLDFIFTSWGGIGGQCAWVRSALPCSGADNSAPFGVLDLADIGGFTSAFLSGGDAADLAAPFGVLDLADINAFISQFLAGCP